MTKENLGKILIVDDTLANLKILTALLDKAGYSVRGAANGKTAIMACKNNPPELILLDILMPDMDGYEVCSILKSDQQTKDIPIIFISALDMLGNRVKGFQLGAVDYITKPFQPEEVLVRVNTHLQLYRMQMNLELMVSERTIALQKSNSALMDSEEKFRGLVENTSDWIWEVNERGQYTYSSPQIYEILGYFPNEIIGKTPFEFMPPQEALRVNTLFQQFASKAEPFKTIEHINCHKNGLLVAIESSGVPVINNEDIYQGYRGVSRDITARKEAEEKMNFMVKHDMLTKLPNRLLFNEHLDKALKKAVNSSQRVAMLFLNLDRFKDVNETFGHPMGDLLLVQVATRLSEVKQKIDTLAHFGGDEFALLFDDFKCIDDIERLAKDLLAMMNKPFYIEEHELFLGTSIGISLCPEHGKQVLEICRNADSALNRAKENGRNSYQFYTDDLTDAATERLNLATRLRHALKNNEFQIFYQPQVELKNSRIIGAEALIRWLDPEHGLISPVKFIPLAEDTGLIIPIGEWVLRESCRQFAQWRDEGNPLNHISVNISGVQIQRVDLPKLVTEVLKDFQIKPVDLDLEVTESMLMDNPQHVTEILHALRKIGVSLAVDDFGTGYSSLSYLKRFPINTLKIDRSFVQDIPDDADDAAIAKAIIAMANTLQLNTLAEGIETKEQRDFLLNEGCEYGQGYLYSRPVPAAEFLELLKSGLSI